MTITTKMLKSEKITKQPGTDILTNSRCFVNFNANFDPVYFSFLSFVFCSSLDKAPVCTGLILSTNSHHGRIWDVGRITNLTELCLSCSSTCDLRLTGLTLLKSVSVESTL